MPSHRHMAVKNGHNPSGKKQIKNTERAKLAFSVLFFNSMFLHVPRFHQFTLQRLW